MMDSDDEDVSENDILDWYKSEVADIWDTATDSAFADLSSNFTEMFRQVMNDVKQRSQSSQVPNGHAVEVNGHSSAMNGVHEQQPEPEATTNTVSVSTDQLMAMLQDEDDDWLEDSSTPSQDEEPMVLSVQLTDPQNQTEENQKNVKGVSQENNPLADSIILQFGNTFQTVMPASHPSSCFFVLLTALYTVSLTHKLSQMWYLKNIQDYVYPVTSLFWLAYPFLTGLREESCLISNLFGEHGQKFVDRRSYTQVIELKKEKSTVIKSPTVCYSGSIPIVKDTSDKPILGGIKEIHSKMSRKLLQFLGGFISNRFWNLSNLLPHRELRAYSHIDSICSIHLFHHLRIQLPKLCLEVLTQLLTRTH
ncbi:uncharacterized protein LOC116926532 [Daphnia magna]|uniref:Uncharacterized protein n=1 Tax=Daphnia magna TaxID=35525 RepID=A0A162C7D4_9CRUS|nr:uncharacterized protein LOC116926532 [Daphnia magna]KZS12372.1 Uncharacterized protein APZ42_022465 [Daphnia magna]